MISHPPPPHSHTHNKRCSFTPDLWQTRSNMFNILNVSFVTNKQMKLISHTHMPTRVVIAKKDSTQRYYFNLKSNGKAIVSVIVCFSIISRCRPRSKTRKFTLKCKQTL